MSVDFGLSICMARGNNCTVGNENDLLGLLFRVRGVGENEGMKGGRCNGWVMYSVIV